MPYKIVLFNKQKALETATEMRIRRNEYQWLKIMYRCNLCQEDGSLEVYGESTKKSVTIIFPVANHLNGKVKFKFQPVNFSFHKYASTIQNLYNTRIGIQAVYSL